MAVNKEDILEAVGAMSVMELNDLVKAFEEKFGVSAASMAVAGPGAAAAVAEEKTEFDVVLTGAGANKVERHQGGACHHRPRSEGSQGCGRRRAQDSQGRLSKAEADDIAKQLTEAGATVEIK